MAAGRALLSCLGLFLCAFLLLGLAWGVMGFFATRAIVETVEREVKRDDARREEHNARMTEYRREAQQRRQGTRIDSESGRPMQRPRPMVDVSR